MPEAATAAAPVAAPVAAAQPAPSAKPESFNDQMMRLGGYDPEAVTDAPVAEAVTEEPAAQAAAETAEPEPKAAKGKKGKKGKADEVSADAAAPAEPSPPPPAELGPAVQDEIEHLKALAKKHGLEFDGTAVLTRERSAFREHQRKMTAYLEERKQTLATQLEERLKEGGGEIALGRELRAAYQRGDAEAISKLLGAENWEKLQEHLIQTAADPNFLRIQELERKVEEQKRRDEQERKERAAQSENNQRIERQRRYVAELQAGLAKSNNPMLATFADDPAFVDTIYRIQERYYDAARGTTVTPEQALNLAPFEGAAPLGKRYRQLYDRLHKVYGKPQGDPPASPPAAAAPATQAPRANDRPGAKPRPKTGVVPSNATPAPAKTSVNKMSQKDWLKYAHKRLAEAAEQDRRDGN